MRPRAPYAISPDMSNMGGGGAYNGFLPESVALFNRMSPAPSPSRQILIDATIQQFIAAGIWARLDALWFMAAASSQAAGLNWLSSSFTLTAVSSPTFTTDRGYTGDGVAAYLDTGFTPSTAGGKYTQNDMVAGVFARSAGTTGIWLGGQATSSTQWTQIQDIGADIGYRVNAGTAATATGAKTAGLGAAQRTSSTAVAYYKDGASISTGSVASDGVPDRPIFLLCRNRASGPSPDPANFTNAQLSVGFFGGALTAAQHAAFNTIVTSYLTGVGAV